MKKSIGILLIVLSIVFAVSAQTTEFSFQGSLKDGASAANGNYDFEFALFDAVSGGAQLGSTLTQNNIAVANGIFSVKLDFGSQFPGANRFLEIRLRPAGNPGGFQQLLPRQTVNSTPYSVKSLNADNATDAINAANATTATSATNAATATNALSLGGVAANQYVVTTDPRMTDSRAPTAGSTNYVQNSTVLQSATNFNISGNGTAGGTLRGDVIRADTGFNIGLNRVVSVAGTNNTFVGALNGDANTTGTDNSFFGRSAGTQNTSGSSNSFFGSSSGFSNTTGARNTFVGRSSGLSNNASDNSFFGYFAGRSNTSGTGNSFFGANAGDSNTTGNVNSFFGNGAGQANTTGYNNSFVGWLAGSVNTDGTGNSFFGVRAGTSNTFGGYNSFVGTDAGIANTMGGGNAFFGEGSGSANTLGSNNVFLGSSAGGANTTGDHNTAIGDGADVASNNLSYATAIGSDSKVSQSNSISLGRPVDTVRIPGNLDVTGNTSLNGNLTFANGGIASISSANFFMTSLPAGVGTTLCRTASNQIVTCSSSLRYKTNIGQFNYGLSLVNRLKPITFDWKDGGMHDLGLSAEDVAAIEPLLVTYNDKGQVEGVKYDRIGVVLINAFKEQQEQIEKQQALIEQLEERLEQLEKKEQK